MADERPRLDLWWVPAVAGIVLLTGGIALTLWPATTVTAGARALGLVLTVGGIALALSSLASLGIGHDWAVLAYEAIWVLALGIPLLLVPQTSARALALVVGVLFLLGGSLEIIAAATLSGYLFGRSGYMLRGLAGTVLGGLLIFLPGSSIAAVAVVAGAWMAAAGSLLLLFALALAGFGSRA